MTETFKTISPIDNSMVVERPFATAEEIQRALSCAQSIFPQWRQTPIEERARLCSLAIDDLVSRRETLARELCWQMGRPIRYASGEINGLEERARYMIAAAKTALTPIQVTEKPGFIRYIQREPFGISLIIAPWNYPYLTAINSIIPAIMAGNVVILKHSTQTPLVAERFAEAFIAAGFPQGVFQYLHLTHASTEHLLQTAPIHHVAFTGSVDGGAQIERATAGRFLNVGLELGGKDPAYIRADANLQQAVETVIDGAFFNSGQSCCGIERIYVHEAIFDAFLDKAISLVSQYYLGRSDDPKTTLGPMVRASAADAVREQIHDALQQGAIAHVDTSRFPLDQPGSPYLAPQLLTHVHHNMRIMSEETFGPVVGIMAVKNDDEAIELMNDSEYGLTAALFTQDIETGIQLGQQINTGTFFINRCDYLDPALAWTGIKKSGRGCSLSIIGYETLTRPKSFHIKKS